MPRKFTNGYLRIDKSAPRCGRKEAAAEEFRPFEGDEFHMLDRLSLILVVIGAINWGSVGIFRFDFIAWLFGGQEATISRVVYTLVALAGIWCVSLLFRSRNVILDDEI